MTDIHTSAGARPPDTEDERTAAVLAIIHTVLGKPELGADDDIVDHGGTSLSIVRVLAESARLLEADINPRDLAGSVTARSVARAAR